MPERLITHLRYAALAIPDYTKQLAFYQDLWGLEPVANDSGVAFLAAAGSPEQYVVRLRQSERKRVDLVAFGAATVDDVDTLAARLVSAGVQLVSEPGKLDTPGAGYGVRFFDPDGRVIEVSADVQTRQHRKIEEREDIPVRLSHVVINSADPVSLAAFYEKHLGFAISDTLTMPGVGPAMVFMRCNAQHHVFAISRAMHASLNHVSFEMRGLDEYMRGTGRLKRAGVKMLWGPGRHLGGDNTFSYFLDPSGNVMEYTAELEMIDEDLWHPHVYDCSDPTVLDQWGTANTFQEMIQELMRSGPGDTADPVFEAPPI